MNKKRLAILASGSGTNAEAIMKYFENSDLIEVALVLSNKSDAYVLTRAEKFNVKSKFFDRRELYDSTSILDLLESNDIDYIILAGFLWLIPKNLIAAYKDRIINIHPALLPNYGGKGMYGDKVHQAVIANDEKQSGITIHLVDEIYDNGRILNQKTVEIKSSDTPEILASKIHELEHQFFPSTIEEYIVA
ncbi:MAG: phosphoribosylglycinamide formyltransferase [Reichenbachiella sp.]